MVNPSFPKMLRSSKMLCPRLWSKNFVFVFTPDEQYTIRLNQSVIFKLLSYCFEETIGFDINASFARSPVSQYNKRVLRLFSSTGLLMDWKLQTEIRIYASFLSKHEFRQIKPLKMSFPWSFYSSFSIAELLRKATLPPVPTDIP